MKLLQELSKMTEAAVMGVLMDTICKAIDAAKCKGESYEQALKNIAAEFRKLDKHDSSKMSDEALKDLIMSFYNQDKHLSANDNVVSYRDTGFSKGQGPGVTPGATDGIVNNRVNQIKEEAGDDQADVAREFEALMKKHKKSMKPADVKKFEKAFDNKNKEWLHIYQHDESEDEDAEEAQRENLRDALGELEGVLDDLKHHLKLAEEEGVEPAPKRDLKAEAIGIATAWLNSNYKKFNLPLKVRRVPTSGKYIMTTVVANKGETPKRIFLKVLDGEAKQVSSKEWKMLDEADISASGGDMAGASGSLDNQFQGGIPVGAADPHNGPQGGEVATPPPSNKPPAAKAPSGPATRTIAKGGDFRVDLGQNEQVSIIDGKGNIRLSMPMVIWKELTRQ